MRQFVYKLLQQANLPVTYSQFWWYTGIFWGVLAIISYAQSTMVWLLSNQQVMHISESVQWFITYLLWLGLTPAILYSAQRFSIRRRADANPAVFIHSANPFSGPAADRVRHRPSH